jgi:hypothetical protein
MTTKRNAILKFAGLAAFLLYDRCPIDGCVGPETVNA